MAKKSSHTSGNKSANHSHQESSNSNKSKHSGSNSSNICSYLLPVLVAVLLATVGVAFMSSDSSELKLSPHLHDSHATANSNRKASLLMSLTDKDWKQVEARGSSREEVERQLKNFRDGFGFTRITKPTIVGDGIKQLSEQELKEYVELYDKESPALKTIKFVPASGAASRMFKALFAFLQAFETEDRKELLAKFEKGEPELLVTFFDQIEKFAFYNDLNAAVEGGVEKAVSEKRYDDVLKALLTDAGLSYGTLPKGMLRFHEYEPSADNADAEIRTPLEEHLVEAAVYGRRADKTAHLHFTVSPSHLDGFKARVAAVSAIYETRYDVTFNVAYSVQKPATDTIAVTPDNEPFRLDDGSVLFRAAGHGALIENLNDLDADIVFIKNIDNVVPDRLKDTTYTYKKALGGIIIQAQKRIFAHLKALNNDENAPLSDERMAEIANFIATELGATPPESLVGASRSARIAYLKEKLDRPLRVCGQVPNSGETGGGPFWTASKDGGASIQIVESAQIDRNDPSQSSVMAAATHFNPVDLVCSNRKLDGSRYDLTQYRDLSAGFVSSKSLHGRELKAQELPGLWNGAMADWNTIFVEVPLITFNPVKQVNDLLRPEHQK